MSVVSPVTFASGRARFVTTPSPTGSCTTVKTIGIDDVARLAARVSRWPVVTMTSTFARTSPAARPGKCSTVASARAPEHEVTAFDVVQIPQLRDEGVPPVGRARAGGPERQNADLVHASGRLRRDPQRREHNAHTDGTDELPAVNCWLTSCGLDGTRSLMRARTWPSFDDVIGAQQHRWRHSEAESPRRFEIDHHVELRR